MRKQLNTIDQHDIRPCSLIADHVQVLFSSNMMDWADKASRSQVGRHMESTGCKQYLSVSPKCMSTFSMNAITS
jgi:hypothetical protein